MKNRDYKLYKKKRIYIPKLWMRGVSLLLLMSMLTQICFPLKAFALTSGPQQPEASNFTPADVSNLVDPFTGDFSYNIPMFEIGGYPVNLSYNSGVSMDQEATWTGLGWNLNTGAITRDVRGLPDDFWGDEITRTFNTKPNITAGGSVTIGAEFTGWEIPASASYGIQMKYNNYAGFSVGQTLNGGIQFPSGVNLGLGLSTTNGGLDINPNISFSKKVGEENGTTYKSSLGFGLNINSRTGISQMSLNASVSASNEKRGFTADKKEGIKKYTEKNSISASGGGSINFLNPTHTPQNTLPFKNFNFSGSFKLGGAVFFGDLSGTIAGFYSEQSLMTNTMANPGYGYIYSEKGQFVSNATHDFNREKDGPFTNNTPTLPLTNYTYDAFNIKAQGIGGSFRGFRNDMGHLFDPDMSNPSVGASFGAELDLGNAVDFGLDINVNWNESKTGKWSDGNAAVNQMKFTQPSTNSLYENVFFKMVGEKVSETDNDYLNRIQKDKAVSVKLEDSPTPMALNMLSSGTNTLVNNNNYRDERLIRNTSIQCFTVADVKFGFPRYAKYLPGDAPDHHIAMIVVTTADGTRYVFGLPAYNKVKREVTMATGGNIDATLSPLANDTATNLLNYANTTTASVSNQHGIDNYYDKTETPMFVYTWYLTEVLSPDYSDLTGDGATPDDLGGYVKFTYGVEDGGLMTPNIPNYKWRTPSNGSTYQATYSPGLKTIITDDKATYLYGEKDIWYPSTIESKTQLVKFDYSDRRDGFGVTGEHNAIGGSPQQKIDKIDIYSRQDYVSNGGSAVPLKTIHFEYDYSLCPGVFNNSGASETVGGDDINEAGGKLTLKKVYFTYRNSAKAKYSSYSFEYPTGNKNPAYDPTANDRWGSYRDNSSSSANKIPRNEDFPYTLQDSSFANYSAACWNLKSINLPTGGKINVEYESDDYAYVQDKKACDMFQIVGSGQERDSEFSNNLFDDGSNSFEPYEYLFFKLETPIPTTVTLSDADETIREQYFADPSEPETNGPPKYLYFRFLTNVNNGYTTAANEYVSGYADVSDGQYCGVWNGSEVTTDYEYGWVKLKTLPADGGGTDYHPISKSAWAFSRINTPFYANDQPVPGQSDPGDFLRTILNADIIAQLIQFFQGPNNKLRSHGFASKFVILDEDHPYKGSSWIRLYDPNQCKYGGGHRVKRITISDNWDHMEGDEDAFQYGQEYVYNNADGTSNGVASFEPMYGADENPFRIPVFYNKEYGPLIPDDRFYQEEPFGESFFPSPVVGYSKVKIMNLQRDNVTKTATGYTLKEFFTAKDFPTKTSRTNLDMHRAKIDPLLAIFSPYTFDFMTNSQGFCIELNDMHGKPKRESVFQENNDADPISYVNHFYKLESGTVNEISNILPVLEKTGDVSTREIGTEIDIVSDFRESKSTAGNVDVGFNLDYMQFGPIPLIIPALFPKIKLEDTDYRSASVTKVVNRYVTEVKTEAFDLGSKVATENMLFNGISGEPLSTKVNNEYEDDRYTLSVPAYWAYPGMQHGSTNEGFVMVSTAGNGAWNRSTGEITITGKEDFFEPGDEVIRYNYSPDRMPILAGTDASDFFNRLWVARDSAGTKLYFIDRFGQPCTTGTTNDIAFKVIRSGHRNILNPKIAEFATLEPPVTNFSYGDLDIDNGTKVLSVTSQTFAEQWKTLKRFKDCEADTGMCVCAPEPWALMFTSMINNTITNDVIYDAITSFRYLKIFDHDEFYHGFNADLLDYIEEHSACSVVTGTRIYINIGGGPTPWDPLGDTDFLNGTERSLSILFVGPGESGTCGACSGYTIAIVDREDIPSGYFNNADCTDEIDGEAPEDILYVPVHIGSQLRYLKFKNPSDLACGHPRSCNSEIIPPPDHNTGDAINPYIHNILGKWRPYESFTFIEDRTGSTTAEVNLRDAGYIDGYSDFWHIYSSAWTYSGFDDDHWKRTTTMTQYHPSGPQVEEKNALDIYSAAQYGYFEQLAVAVAQNAQYKEIGFDGFEDYDYLDGTILQYAGCNKTGHFRFDEFSADIVNTQSHTGRRSLSVASGTSYFERNLQTATAFRTTRNVPYLLQAKDILELFGPVAGAADDKVFVFSFWVKQSNYTPVMFDYGDVSGDILLDNVSILSGTLKKSPIINGWQKFEYQFTVDNGESGVLKVALVADGVTAYFDDVRIHPFNSMMKSYVYDPLDLRFMAELDENNYATFYEYDEDGALIRVKKETERGVMTIQENRYGSYKY